MSMLRASDVTVYYGAFLALDGASFRIGSDSIVAVLGPNGAGKTTLVNSISGLVRPVSGSIIYGRDELLGLRPDQRTAKRISHVPERQRVFGQLTVLENLQIGGHTTRKRSKQSRSEAYNRVYEIFPILYEKRFEKAIRMSGGERQMLAIATGLMSDPQLLILDEPFTGLAPNIVRSVAETVVTLRSQGISVMFIEHNIPLALELADYGYLLEAGRIILEGPGERMSKSDELKVALLGSEEGNIRKGG